MHDLGGLGMRWIRWRFHHGPADPDPRPRHHRWHGVACPHCTNLDTLTPHCANERCDWSRCACGALVYGGRGHRHPRHGSDQDTCHSPRAAV